MLSFLIDPSSRKHTRTEGQKGNMKKQNIKVNGELTIDCSQLVIIREPNIDKDNYKTISG